MGDRHHNGTLCLGAVALRHHRCVLVLSQPTHRLEEQLGALCLGVEAHLRDDLLGVDRRALHRQEAGVGLQGALVAVFLTEDGRSGQRQLQHVAFGVVGQHHSQTLLEAASAAITLARPGNVLRAVVAGAVLRRLDRRIGGLTVIAPAVRSGDVVGIVRLGVEDAVDLGRGLHNDDVQVAVVNGGDFLTACKQTEHTTFDGDALGANTCATAREGLGCVGQLVVTSECGDVGCVKERYVTHG